MHKKIVLIFSLIIIVIISFKIFKYYQNKTDEIKILNKLIQDEIREDASALIFSDNVEFQLKKKLRDYSQKELENIFSDAEKSLLKKEYQVSIYDSLYGVDTDRKYYLEMISRVGFIPENNYQKTEKINFEKLSIRKTLKLKPYNADNIYDKNFWGIFMFSRIMFNSNGKEALVEVRSSTKENNNNDKLIFLKKDDNNEWKIKREDILPPENSSYYEK